MGCVSKSAPYFIGAIAWFSLAMWPLAYVMAQAAQHMQAWWSFPAFILPLTAYLGVTASLLVLGVNRSVS